MLGVFDDEEEGFPRRLRTHAQQVDDVGMGADALHYLHLLDKVSHVLRGGAIHCPSWLQFYTAIPK